MLNLVKSGNDGRKWNLIIIVCLIVLAFAHPARSQEIDANDIDILSGYGELFDMGVKDSNDGFTIGFYGQESASSGDGKSVLQVGYDYGVMNAFFGIDISEPSYFHLGVKFYTRDLADVNSVPYLSNIVLLLADTEAVVLASSGMAHSWLGNTDHTSTLVGLKIKGSINSPVSFQPEVWFPLDAKPVLFFGMEWKF